MEYETWGAFGLATTEQREEAEYVDIRRLSQYFSCMFESTQYGSQLITDE
jgi:hypothetical protein